MKTINTIIVSSLALSSLLQLAHSVPVSKNLKVNCVNFLEKLDSCGLAASYSFIYDDYGYPINEKALEKSCAVSQEGFNCLRQYGKCFDPVVKQGLMNFIKGRKTRVNQLCKEPSSNFTKSTMSAFKCMYDHKKTLFTTGEKTLVKRLDAISSAADLEFDKRLQLTCCTIFDYRKRFLDDLAPQCGKYRNEISEEVRSLIGEVVPMMCTKYDGNDHHKQCANLPMLKYPQQTKAKSLTRTILEIVVLMGNKEI